MHFSWTTKYKIHRSCDERKTEKKPNQIWWNLSNEAFRMIFGLTFFEYIDSKKKNVRKKESKLASKQASKLVIKADKKDSHVY